MYSLLSPFAADSGMLSMIVDKVLTGASVHPTPILLPDLLDEVSQEDINLILIDDDDCLLSCDDSDHSSPVVTSKTCIFLQKYTNICLSVLACTLAVCAIVLTGVYICARCRDY